MPKILVIPPFKIHLEEPVKVVDSTSGNTVALFLKGKHREYRAVRLANKRRIALIMKGEYTYGQ